MADDSTESDRGSAPADADELAALRAENERLRSEHATMQAQLAGSGAPNDKKGSPVRTFFAWLFAILAIIALVVSVAAVWVQTTLDDQDRFVSTLEPLPQDDAVAAAVSVRIADGVVEATDVETAISSNLPPELSFAAGPLTEAVRELTVRASDTVIQTDAFTAVWNTATGAAQRATDAVLTGNDGALEAEGGAIAINLDTIAEPVVDRLSDSGLDLSSLVGEDFSLGSIELYEDEELAAAQEVAQAIDRAAWVFPLVALVLIIAAVLVAADRRRIVSILGFGTAIGMLLMLIALRISRLLLVNAIDDELNQDAAKAAWDIVLRYWTGALWAMAFLGLVVGIVAWLVGPSERAGRSRVTISGWFSRWREPTAEEPTGFTGFVYRYRRPIQWIIVALGIIVLLASPLTLWLAVVVVLVVLLLVALVEIIAGPKRVQTQEPVQVTVGDSAVDD
jgi:hypothetical protein